MTVLAPWIVLLLEIYVAVGLLFGIAFVLRGVDRIDPFAAESTRGFRLIVLPGAIALWPLLLRRWVSGLPPPAERSAHRDATRQGDR